MALDATDTFVDGGSSKGGVGTGANSLRPVNRVPKEVEVFYKPKEAGDMTLVIVPYRTTQCLNPRVKPGELHWFREYTKWKGLGNDGKGSVLNVKASLNRPCAIHDHLNRFPSNKKPRSQNMVLMNIYDMATGKMYLMDYSMHNFYKPLKDAVAVASQRKHPRTGQLTSEWVRYFPDPVDGAFIQFNWSKKEFAGTPFFDAGNFQFEKHEGFVQKEGLIDKALDLDALINVPDYNTVLELYVNGGYVADEPPYEGPEGDAPPLMDEPFTQSATTTTAQGRKPTAPTPPVDMESPIDADWDN